MSGAAPDRIRLSGVRGRGFHGVFDHERREGQEFVVDVELAVDLSAAGATDDLADTVDYGRIGAAALARIEGEPHDLIERLAELVALDALAHPAVDEVVVTVHKPQAPVGVPFGDVTVSVTRRRAPVPVVVAVGANLPARLEQPRRHRARGDRGAGRPPGAHRHHGIRSLRHRARRRTRAADLRQRGGHRALDLVAPDRC